MDFPAALLLGVTFAGINGIATPMNLNFTTKATTGGFVAGADRTDRNFGPEGGTLITGILTGYLWSNLSSSITSSPVKYQEAPALVPSVVIYRDRLLGLMQRISSMGSRPI